MSSGRWFQGGALKFSLDLTCVMCPTQAVAPLPRTQSHLLRIVSTLEADYMHAQPPKSLEQLEQYAEGSSSQLLYLQVTPYLHPMLCVHFPIDLHRLPTSCHTSCSTRQASQVVQQAEHPACCLCRSAVPVHSVDAAGSKERSKA